MNLRPLLAVVALVLTGGLLSAQAPKLTVPSSSPASTLKQRVGITDIEVEYSRPGIKGRKIFGDLVPFDATWRTGANSATKISFSTPVKLGGKDVPAGSYELFTIPGKSLWTVMIQPVQKQWGDYKYDESKDTARFTVKPAKLSTPLETFTIAIGDIRDTSATIYLSWERTTVPISVDIDTVGMVVPQIEAAMASPEPKKPYLAAAMFYLDNGLDLKQALAWADAAIAENPKAFYIVYRKGLILEKMSKKSEALAAAKQSLALIEAADPKAMAQNLRDEYTRLNQRLISRLN